MENIKLILPVKAIRIKILRIFGIDRRPLEFENDWRMSASLSEG